MIPAFKKCPGVNHQEKIPNRVNFQEARMKRSLFSQDVRVIIKIIIKAQGKIVHISNY